MTKITKAQEKANQVLENKRTAFVKKARTLLGHVGMRLASDELTKAFNDGVSVEDYAASVAAKEPVGLALHPMKEVAVERADKNQTEYLNSLLTKLEEGNGDLDKVFPYPRFNRYDDEAQHERNVHNLVSRITEEDKTAKPVNPDAPSYNHRYPRIINQEGFDRVVNQARTEAAMQYDMFICKMVAKVGEVVSASIEGSHVWGYSFLTVEKKDGSKEVWKTQQIVNVSKLGTYFNQWPSRKMK